MTPLLTELEVAAADLVVKPRCLERSLRQRKLVLPTVDRLLKVALSRVNTP